MQESVYSLPPGMQILLVLEQIQNVRVPLSFVSTACSIVETPSLASAMHRQLVPSRPDSSFLPSFREYEVKSKMPCTGVAVPAQKHAIVFFTELLCS